MTTPERSPLTYAAWQEEDAARVAADYAMTPSLHHQAMTSAHEGRPTVAMQDRNNGAGLPDVDNGPEPGTVVG